MTPHAMTVNEILNELPGELEAEWIGNASEVGVLAASNDAALRDLFWLAIARALVELPGVTIISPFLPEEEQA